MASSLGRGLVTNERTGEIVQINREDAGSEDQREVATGVLASAALAKSRREQSAQGWRQMSNCVCTSGSGVRVSVRQVRSKLGREVTDIHETHAPAIGGQRKTALLPESKGFQLAALAHRVAYQFPRIAAANRANRPAAYSAIHRAA